MRFFLALLLLLHALINSLGFIKSIRPGLIPQLKENIPTLHGLGWLLAAVLFILAALMIFAQKIQWWMLALPAIIISQALVIYYWQDAKMGTIANIMILVATFIALSEWRFKNTFLSDVKRSFQNEQTYQQEITEKDLEGIPEIVKKYLKYTGHKEKVTHFYAVLEGEIRSGPNAEWMKFTAIQYSWTNRPTRFFFMNATMKGLPVAGYHCLKDEHASMDIRAMSLIPVSRAAGTEMDISETVTHLNDMCLLAPASLIDRRISWVRAEDQEAELVFNYNDIKVRAVIQFNEKGELTNFISEDRYMVTSGQPPRKARWSTPVTGYQEKNGIRYPAIGEAIWETPDAKYAYAKMNILSVRINPVGPN